MDEATRQARLNALKIKDSQLDEEYTRQKAEVNRERAALEHQNTVPLGYCTLHYFDHREKARLLNDICWVCEHNR